MSSAPDSLAEENRALRAEVARLQAAEEQYRAFLIANSDLVYKMGPDWTEIRLLDGDNFLANAEQADAVWLKKNIPLEDQPAVLAAVADAIRNRTPFSLEHRVIRRAGSIGWIFSRAVPLLDADGKIREWLGAATDITPRKRREAQIAFLADLTELLTTLNTASEIVTAFGQRVGEFLGASVCTFVEVDEAQNEVFVTHDWHRTGGRSLVGRYHLPDYFNQDYQERMSAGQPIIVRDTSKDGRVQDRERLAALRIGSLMNVPLMRDGTWHFIFGVYHEAPYPWLDDEVALVLEITARLWSRLERIRAEEALRKSEEKYRTLFTSIDEGLLIAEVLFDEAGKAIDYRFLETNAAFYVHSRLPRDVTGMTMREIAPDTPIPWLPIYQQVVETRTPIRFEYNIEMEQLRGYYEVHILPLGAQEEHRIAVLFQNITERNRNREALLRHQAEIETLNSRLRRAMQETHHRIKNNLQTIAALVEMQSYGSALGDEAAMHRINTHIRSLATIHDLLTQQAKGDADLNALDTRSMLERLIPILQNALVGRRIDAEIAPLPLPVTQSAALTLLVNELISNAVKHTSGDIEIRLQPIEEEPKTAERRTARLEVCDHGPGFPPDFDPREAANTGLELIESAARWDLKGDILYTNRPEGGACVVVTFPLIAPLP